MGSSAGNREGRNDAAQGLADDTSNFLNFEVKSLSGVLGAQSNTKQMFKQIVGVVEGLEREVLDSFCESYASHRYLLYVLTALRCCTPIKVKDGATERKFMSKG